MANGKHKGSQFERDFCKELSLWWSQNHPEPREDLFWRTSNSGGRATVRSGKGKKTSRQYGDITATDAIGEPLLDVFTIEIKRGYNRDSVADLLDSPNPESTTFGKWIKQAIESHKQANSLSWALIVKRDRRIPIIYLPYQTLFKLFCPVAPILSVNEVSAMPLKLFFDNIRPEKIIQVAKEQK